MMSDLFERLDKTSVFSSKCAKLVMTKLPVNTHIKTTRYFVVRIKLKINMNACICTCYYAVAQDENTFSMNVQ